MSKHNYQPATPFTATHRRRKDGMEAMLLAKTSDARALYRVSHMHAGRMVDSTTVRDWGLFEADFEVVA